MKEYSALESAYLTEATQAARFELFAMRAKNDGRTQLAALYRAIAKAKNVHAAKALMQLRGKIGDTEANHAEALESLDSLPNHLRELVENAESSAAESLLTQCLKTSMNHAARAKRIDEDAHVPYPVCTVCGFIAEGDTPDRCPVCHALPSKFVET